MDFDLSDEQKQLQESIDAFFAQSFSLSRVRECYDGEMPTLDGLNALGLCEMLIPEEYGGGGGTVLDVAVAAERLGAAAAPGPFIGRVMASYAISVAGNEEQRRRWLPALASGEKRATIAIAEHGSRWRPESLALRGDRLAGEKWNVLVGDDTDLVVVVLADGLAVVELDSPGVTVAETETLDRTRPLATLLFDGPECDLLAEGAAATERVLDLGAVLVAADAYGGAARCLDLAVEYSKLREQFGTTIAHFQAVKHQLADIAIEVLPSRGMYWYAAHALDCGQDDAGALVSLAKAHITERYIAAARRSIEIHGGIGYTWECDLHFFLRRAVFNRAYLGSPEVHRQRRAHTQLAHAR